MAKDQYRIVSHYNLVIVTKQVDELIAQGYEPIGGLAVSGSPVKGEEVFYQAMYRVPRMTFGVDIGKGESVGIGTVEKPNRQIVPFIDKEFEEAVKPKDKKKS